MEEKFGMVERGDGSDEQKEGGNEDVFFKSRPNITGDALGFREVNSRGLSVEVEGEGKIERVEETVGDPGGEVAHDDVLRSNGG